MIRRLRSLPLCALFALLVLGGALSAARMAPDRADVAVAAAAAVLGPVAADLCADDRGGHGAHDLCPWCRALPRTEPVGPAAAAPAEFALALWPHADRARPPRAAAAAAPARAPPRAA